MAKSTGPKTPQGKARSAQNAVKHGLLKAGWIDGEEEKAYCQLFNALMDDYLPVGAAEQLQVERIAINTIKLMRLHRVENAQFAKAADDMRAPRFGQASSGLEYDNKLAVAIPIIRVLDTLIRYQTSMERQISKATGELLALQDRRMAHQRALASVPTVEEVAGLKDDNSIQDATPERN